MNKSMKIITFLAMTISINGYAGESKIEPNWKTEPFYATTPQSSANTEEYSILNLKKSIIALRGIDGNIHYKVILPPKKYKLKYMDASGKYYGEAGHFKSEFLGVTEIADNENDKIISGVYIPDDPNKESKLFFVSKSLANTIFTRTISREFYDEQIKVRKTNRNTGVYIPTGSINKAPDIKKDGATWKPETYDLNTSKFPKNYQGTNPIKFLELLKSKLSKIKEKGEFETTADFEARISNANTFINPINTDDYYAFNIKPYPIQYDADIEAYKVGNPYGYNCGYERLIICHITKTKWKEDSYIGANALGVTKTIIRTIGNYISLKLDNNDSTQDLLRQQDKMSYMALIDIVPVPISKAKNLKSYNIEALLVGKLKEAKLINTTVEATTPKLDEPYDKLITAEAIPFEVTRVIYHVKETGEILGQRDITDSE